MKITAMIKIVVALVATGLMSNSNANSVGFDQDNYSDGIVISVSLIYDFTDFLMFGGSVDIEYDPNALLFIDYTQAPLPSDAAPSASPIGSLTSPGLYSGPGIGGLKFFQGMSGAGTIGTLTFSVIGTNDPGATSCGFALCLLPNSLNPFVSLAGLDVTDELFANGISGANVVVPVPAAVWLILSGLIGLIGFGRKSI